MSPFLHKEMPKLALHAKNSGIDISFTTNGVLLTPEKAEQILPATSWIKVSCNAGSARSYSYIHGTSEEDFSKMMHNIEKAINIREKQTQGNAKCTIGFQILVLPENRSEIRELALTIRDMGADYLVLKPYSVNPGSLHGNYKNLNYGNCDDLMALHDLSTDKFAIIYRKDCLQRREEASVRYQRCLAHPFWGYVDSAANLWGCLRHIGDENFFQGSLQEYNFQELLNHPERLEKLQRCTHEFDVTECQISCRMDAVNAYLWELINPAAHVNFI